MRTAAPVAQRCPSPKMTDNKNDSIPTLVTMLSRSKHGPTECTCKGTLQPNLPYLLYSKPHIGGGASQGTHGNEPICQPGLIGCQRMRVHGRRTFSPFAEAPSPLSPPSSPSPLSHRKHPVTMQTASGWWGWMHEGARGPGPRDFEKGQAATEKCAPRRTWPSCSPPWRCCDRVSDHGPRGIPGCRVVIPGPAGTRFLSWYSLDIGR